MKFKELLDVLIDGEFLILDVQSDDDYGSFSGTTSDFEKDEKFHDLNVINVKSVIVSDDTDHRINDNVYSVKTEIWITLYDLECKVLEPYEED